MITDFLLSLMYTKNLKIGYKKFKNYGNFDSEISLKSRPTLRRKAVWLFLPTRGEIQPVCYCQRRVARRSAVVEFGLIRLIKTQFRENLHSALETPIIIKKKNGSKFLK